MRIAPFEVRGGVGAGFRIGGGGQGGGAEARGFVGEQIMGDVEEVGGDFGGRGVSGCRAPNAQERFLEEILRTGAVSGESIEVGEKGAFVESVQFLEGGRVARLDAEHEVGFVIGHRQGV